MWHVNHNICIVSTSLQIVEWRYFQLAIDEGKSQIALNGLAEQTEAMSLIKTCRPLQCRSDGKQGNPTVQFFLT